MSDGGKSHYGFCNICDSRQALTWDHVPPRGSLKPTAIEINSFLDYFNQTTMKSVDLRAALADLKRFPRRPAFSQNGLKFRSICAHCNNVLLGGRYDPELKRIATSIGQVVKARFSAGSTLPQRLAVSVKTHLLLRGIIGHLLAAHASPDQSKSLPGFGEGLYRAMREYFLEETLPFPANLCVYYWLFPSEHQIIMQGLGISYNEGNSGIVGDLIKFFPLAFYVVDESIGDGQLPVPKIVGDGCNDLACSVDLHLDFSNVPPLDWPETPTSHHNTMMPVDSSVVAVPRSRVPMGDNAQPRRSSGRPFDATRFRR